MTGETRHALLFGWDALETLRPPSTQADRLLQNHIYRRSRAYFAAGDTARDRLRTPGEVVARQRALRRFLVRSLGGLPELSGPLHAKITGTVMGDGFRIEKVIYQARPQVYVTANLYLPGGCKGPTGAVLFLCGHAREAKHWPEYQIVCQTLVQAGLIVLIQDPLGQGERLSYFDARTGRCSVGWGVPEHEHAGEQCRLAGDTIARYFLHDAMRGIDYLRSRPEVAPDRIGVTGNSGGGMQASLLMMTDPRLAAAAPATFITSRAAYQRTGDPQDAEQIWPGFTAAGFDHEDVLIAMAPKPVCVLATKRDFFPIAGTRRTVRRARSVWKLFGQPRRLVLVVDDAGHAYTPALAEAAADFFQRCFKTNRGAARPGKLVRLFSARKLRCTPSGQVRGEWNGAHFVFEENQRRLDTLMPNRTRSLSKARAWWRRQVFSNREAAPYVARVLQSPGQMGDLQVECVGWRSISDLANAGVLFQSVNGEKRLPVTLAIWDEGTAALRPHRNWIKRECGRGRAVFVVSLSGMGPFAPAPINSGPIHGFFSTWHKLSDDLDWIGDSMAALRTFEVTRAIDALAHWPSLSSRHISIFGQGSVGVLGRLAAEVDVRITEVRWEKPFSYRAWARTRDFPLRDLKPYLVTGLLRYFHEAALSNG